MAERHKFSGALMKKEKEKTLFEVICENVQISKAAPLCDV